MRANNRMEQGVTELLNSGIKDRNACKKCLRMGGKGGA